MSPDRPTHPADPDRATGLPADGASMARLAIITLMIFALTLGLFALYVFLNRAFGVT